MSDPSSPASDFSRAVKLVDQATALPLGEAATVVFEHYRSADETSRQALVLALVGAVTTHRRTPRSEGAA